MVSSVVPCGTWAMKFFWGSIVTSTRILPNIRKIPFIWDVGGSILVNIEKCSKKMSNSSWLCTLMWATDKVCSLGMESSPNMVTFSSSPWKGMFSTFHALAACEDGGIGTDWGMVASLKDEPFSPTVFCFFADDLTSMALFTLFYCHSQKPVCRLTVISSSSVFSMIDGTIGLASHYSVHYALNASSGSDTISWTLGPTTVFFFASQGARLEVA